MPQLQSTIISCFLRLQANTLGRIQMHPYLLDSVHWDNSDTISKKNVRKRYRGYDMKKRETEEIHMSHVIGKCILIF